MNLALGTALLMSLQLFSYVGSCGTAVDGLEADDDVTSGLLVSFIRNDFASFSLVAASIEILFYFILL